MRPLLWLGSACIAISSPVCTGQALGQVSYPPGVQTSDVQAIVAAAVPQPSTTTPNPDTVGGAVGTMVSYMRADAQPNRITRAGTCVMTLPVYTCSVTWATPFPASVTAVNLVIEPENTSNSPIVCNPSTTRAQNVTTPVIRCWFSRPLPATLTLLSSLISYDVFGGAPYTITVEVIGVPATQ